MLIIIIIIIEGSVKVGSNYVAGKFYIDDLSLMTGRIEDLQKAFRIIENLCASFGFKVVNINKTEICVFSMRGAITLNVEVYYLGHLIKVVKVIK